MYYTCNDLASSTKFSQERANKDQCAWHIYHSAPGYDWLDSYACADEFTSMSYKWKKVRTIKPQAMAAPNKDAVLLTPAEKALVAAVLNPNEPGRDYYPGEEKTKVSLWQKLMGK